MRSLLASILLTACVTDSTDLPDIGPSGATTLPIVNNAGPDILDVRLRCIDSVVPSERRMRLVIDYATTTWSTAPIGTAALMLGNSRMSFELGLHEDGLIDYLYPRPGQEAAMMTLCDSALVDILDLRLTTGEGTTSAAKVRIQPAWQ